jgi:hypothetical protein
MVLSGLLIPALIVQMYLAAVGAFTEPQTDRSYVLHSMNGMVVIPALSILSTIAAALARAPGRLIGLTILPFGMVLGQVVIIVLGQAFDDSTGASTPIGLAITGLHAINGMLIVAVAAAVFRRARTLAAATQAAA